jgi:hypothetical protein
LPLFLPQIRSSKQRRQRWIGRSAPSKPRLGGCVPAVLSRMITQKKSTEYGVALRLKNGDGRAPLPTNATKLAERNGRGSSHAPVTSFVFCVLCFVFCVLSFKLSLGRRQRQPGDWSESKPERKAPTESPTFSRRRWRLSCGVRSNGEWETGTDYKLRSMEMSMLERIGMEIDGRRGRRQPRLRLR